MARVEVVVAGVLGGARDFAIGSISSRLAGAKYVARYFGTVQKTGATRYYRNMIKAIAKKPVKVRAWRQVKAGVYGWVTQQVWQ